MPPKRKRGATPTAASKRGRRYSEGHADISGQGRARSLRGPGRAGRPAEENGDHPSEVDNAGNERGSSESETGRRPRTDEGTHGRNERPRHPFWWPEEHSSRTRPAPEHRPACNGSCSCCVAGGSLSHPLNPNYSPTSPNFSYWSPTYSLPSPNYTPTSPVYSLTSPGFTPTGPVYNPTGPRFTPTSPMYYPTGPAFTPTCPAFSPTCPAYNHTGPAFSPTCPVHNPTGPVGNDLSAPHRPTSTIDPGTPGNGHSSSSHGNSNSPTDGVGDSSPSVAPSSSQSPHLDPQVQQQLEDLATQVESLTNHVESLTDRALDAGLAHVTAIAIAARFPDAVVRIAEDMYRSLHARGILDGRLADVASEDVVAAVLWLVLARHSRYEKPWVVTRVWSSLNNGYGFD